MTCAPSYNRHAESCAPRMGRLRQKQMQAAGLERLIAVLEHAASQASAPSSATPQTCPERPNRLARLRAAHTAYLLANSGMQRAGVNAWVRVRRNRELSAA